jgi:hypothetical protein
MWQIITTELFDTWLAGLGDMKRNTGNIWTN